MQTILLFMLTVSTLGPTKAKLIEWGGDAPPTTAFQHVETLEEAPFDGTVVYVFGKDGDKRIDLAWECWGSKTFTRGQFADAVQDLKNSKRKQFTDCFTRFNVTPGDVNFLDDQAWSVVLNNAKVAAWIAKEGDLKGWMFDVEQYMKKTFSYPEHNKVKPASFEEYQKVSRRRGAEFMKAINSEYPDITLLLPLAYSWLTTEKGKLEDADYGLLSAFYDGMLETVDEKTTFVDALELAYPCKTRADFERLLKLVHEDGRKLCAVPEIYDKRLKIGFGIWIDLGWRNGNWDPHHIEKNFFKPEELQASLQLALELSDSYVWLYSESVSWYSRAGLTEPYIKAVANAQTPPKKVPESQPEVATKPARKAKLLEWGADSPSVQDFRENIERIEATPFDGTVVSVTGKDGDRAVDLGWRFWCKEPFKREFFADQVKNLKAVKRKQFTDVFLRVNVTPGDISFLDDQSWATIVENAKVAAWVAKESNLKGWMFDVEQYEKQVFKYADQNKMQAGSFEEYKKAARRRGSEFIKAINSEFPDITILMTFGYSLAIGDHANLEPALYGLLPAFLDGMLEIAHPDTIMIDGLEFAYGFKTRFEFETLKALMRINGKALSAIPEIYEKRMKMGYGIWIDHSSGSRGWFPHEPEKNHFQPKELEESIRMGLELTETYVWLYSERLNWYTRKAVTEPYLMAVANAQTPPKKVPASKPSP